MLHSKTCIGGMVTAPHHLAAQAGAAVLREGGNAVEAMVAAAAAIAVVYPHMNGIGGDGFWIISEPGREPVAIQACGPSAALADRQFYADASSIPTRGPRAALTVAGAVSGWSLALDHARQWGKAIPVARLLSDAIGHAKAGVPITRSQAQLTRDKWHQLSDQPGFADTYGSAGMPSEGDILKQPALAATLERMAHAGLDDFYRGDLARTLSSGLERLGSPLRAGDFADYRAKILAPLKVQLRAGSVYNLPPPTQGVSALMIIGLFDRLGVTQADGFAHIHGLVEATKRAFILRNAHVTDPAYMSVNASDWLNAALLDSEAARIVSDKAAAWPHPARSGDTIWMGAADAQGRVVSYIQSIFGSLVAAWWSRIPVSFGKIVEQVLLWTTVSTNSCRGSYHFTHSIHRLPGLMMGAPLLTAPWVAKVNLRPRQQCSRVTCYLDKTCSKQSAPHVGCLVARGATYRPILKSKGASIRRLSKPYVAPGMRLKLLAITPT